MRSAREEACAVFTDPINRDNISLVLLLSRLASPLSLLVLGRRARCSDTDTESDTESATTKFLKVRLLLLLLISLFLLSSLSDVVNSNLEPEYAGG